MFYYKVFALTVKSTSKQELLAIRLAYNNLIHHNNEPLEREVKTRLDELSTNVNNGTLSMAAVHSQLDEINYNYGLSKESLKYLSTWMIVALYSLHERTLKGIFKFTERFTVSELNSCYQIRSTKRLLSSKFDINYDDLPHSSLLEELRQLANSIKHGGRVSDDLRELNRGRWGEVTNIEDVIDDFDRLVAYFDPFFEELIELIDIYLENNP